MLDLQPSSGTCTVRPVKAAAVNRSFLRDGRRWVLHREPESNGAQRLRWSVLSLSLSLSLVVVVVVVVVVVDEDFL